MSDIDSVNQMRWSRGHIPCFWNKSDYENLNYVRQNITDEEVAVWVKDGYPSDLSFTGMMYDNKNTMPAIVENFKTYFDREYENLTFTFYKMNTMDIMPTHVDHFRTYCKIFDVNKDDVVRILVMLEDWKLGHYLEINGKGITSWVAGDYFVWENDVPHAASNIGKLVDTRYTLQITATKKKSLKIDSDLYTFNFGPKHNSINIKDDYIINRIQKAINNNNNIPWHLKLNVGRILSLENIFHTEEEIEKLNETGIDIYLYEPLSLFDCNIANYYNSPYHHSEKSYSEFGVTIKEKFLRADELDSILVYSKNNNLSKVRVHLCDWNTEVWLPYYNDNLELIYDDIFLKIIHDRKITNQTFEPVNFKKKFINLNYRYTFHRHLTAAYVSQTTDNYLSWYFKCDYDHAKWAVWYDLEIWKQQEPELYDRLVKGIDYLNQHTPFNLDFNINEPTHIDHIFWKDVYPKKRNITEINYLSIENFYKETFCDIVTESRFAQPTANYSEKIYQAIFYKRPFIVVGTPFTLKLLHSQGFTTFHKFWDETYDSTECHSTRLQLIFKLIDKINNMSLEECNDMYNKMIPLIEHNYQVLKSKIPNI